MDASFKPNPSSRPQQATPPEDSVILDPPKPTHTPLPEDYRMYAQTLGESGAWHKLSMLAKEDYPARALLRLSDKYGDVIKINLKGERIFLLFDVEDFKRILVTKADSYHKYFEGLAPIFGKSMITQDGTRWQNLRAPQQPAFTPKMYGDYLPHLLSSVRDKERDFHRYAATGETINLVEETWGLAASMICKALFNREVAFDPKRVFNAVKTYMDVVNHRDIRAKKTKGEFSEVPVGESAADAIATWLGVPPQVLGASPRDGREKTLLAAIEAAAADPNMHDFDAQQVMDEIKLYLWAGTETTALTLSWCFYVLNLDPEVGERILAESLAAYGDHDPTWEDIQKLTYTKAVIQETMRLYPPVWNIVRQATAEDEIGGHKILPGDLMVLCSYAVHHNPRYWDDPESFDPSRHLPENANKRIPYTYLPFAAGKRACIGGALSIIENTLALSELSRRFRLEYLGEYPAKTQATVTLTPVAGTLPFRVHARG